MTNLPQKDDLIRLCSWNGRIINVFKNGDETNPLYQIRFVKNIIKGQGDEYHSWVSLSDHVEMATVVDLQNEYEQMLRALMVRWSGLLV